MPTFQWIRVKVSVRSFNIVYHLRQSIGGSWGQGKKPRPFSVRTISTSWRMFFRIFLLVALMSVALGISLACAPTKGTGTGGASGRPEHTAPNMNETAKAIQVSEPTLTGDFGDDKNGGNDEPPVAQAVARSSIPTNRFIHQWGANFQHEHPDYQFIQPTYRPKCTG